MAFMILCGMLTGISFIAPSFQYLCYFSLIPIFLWVTKKEETGGRFFFAGFLYGLFLHFVVMSFLLFMHPLSFLGYETQKSLFTVVALYLAVALYEGVLIGLFFWLFHKIRRRKPIDILLFCILYTFMEIGMSLGPLGLTFSHLYLTQHQNRALIQLAKPFSAYGVTFFILLVNGCLTLSIGKKFRFLPFLLALIIFCANGAYGLATIKKKENPSSFLRVAIIQGNISSLAKWGDGSMEQIINTYFNLSHEALKETPQVILWPETTVPIASYEGDDLHTLLSQFARENKIWFITGGFRYLPDEKITYNSVFIFDPEGNEVSPSYHKQHLIPFGEFWPFKEDQLSPGKEATVAQCGGFRVGTLICIDSAFPRLAKQVAAQEPNFIAVLSNDSWFKNSFGLTLHNAHSIFRAVETNHYIARCANTGISGLISPTGEQLHKLPFETTGYILAKIPL